jgi:hypothetical protein
MGLAQDVCVEVIEARFPRFLLTEQRVAWIFEHLADAQDGVPGSLDHAAVQKQMPLGWLLRVRH